MPFLQDCWGNPSSPYRFGMQARMAVEHARKLIADHIGCEPTELVFCSSGTESDNLAVRGVAQALKSKGNHIVTTAIEHHAVHNTCKALESEGFRVTRVPVSAEGVVDVAALAASLCNETTLITVMHANNETGVIQPVEEIAALAQKRGILFHTDATQSAGKLPQRLAELGASLVTISGHKLYGPKGSAILYVRAGTPLIPITTGGAHEHGLRAGTENVAAIVGLAEAMVHSFGCVESQGTRLRDLRDRLERDVCSALQAVRINGARAPRVPNTSSMSFQDVDGESIVLGLDVQGICVSTGSACSLDDHEPSHVLSAMGLASREAKGTVRISLGHQTREEDIDTTVRVLTETVTRLRRISSVRSVSAYSASLVTTDPPTAVGEDAAVPGPVLPS